MTLMEQQALENSTKTNHEYLAVDIDTFVNQRCYEDQKEAF